MFFSAISVVIVNHYDFSVISSKLLYKLVCFWYLSLESWLYQKYINNLRWTFTLQICTTLRWTFHHWTILVRNVPGSCISFDINLCQLQRFSGTVLRSSSSMVTFPFWRPSKPSHASDWEMEMYRSVSIDCVPITLKDKIEYFQKKWSSWLLAIVQGLVHFCSPVFTSKNWSEDGWYWYMLDRCHCRWMVQYVKTLYRITLENIRTGRSTQHRNSVNILTDGNNRHCEHPHWTINTTQKFS